MTIKVDVITPEKLAFTDHVDMVVAPAIDGEIGILPGHTPLITRLGVGEIRLKKGNETEYLAVAGGFLEVHQNDEVSVFAETADMAHDIDLEKERLEAERYREALRKPSPEGVFNLEQAEIALKKSLVRLKVAQLRGAKRGHPKNHPLR